MIWLLVQMWAYLAVAFVLGALVYRWVFGAGSALSAEDVSAELASVRTRHQESEAERARLRARVAELNNALEEAQREARSAAAVARTAVQEAQSSVAPTEAPTPAVEPEPEPEPEEASESSNVPTEPPEPTKPEAPEPAEPPEPRVPPPPIVERPEPLSAEDSPARADPTPFLSEPDRGPPDDLTRIRGVGAKLQRSLNELGVYYYWQIAGWSDEQMAEVDAHFSFPGRIERERWRAQAQRLLEQMPG